MPAVVVQPDQNLEKNQRSSLLGAMDDPEIDLTDGPINVSVELSTRKFYLEHYKQVKIVVQKKLNFFKCTLLIKNNSF
jgi:hypothetical protein